VPGAPSVFLCLHRCDEKAAVVKLAIIYTSADDKVVLGSVCLWL